MKKENHLWIVKKYVRDRLKLTLILIILIAGFIGFVIGAYFALEKCVDIGLRLISLDGVHLDFSDSAKAILKMYTGEWGF